jgi:hypothetical protein
MLGISMVPTNDVPTAEVKVAPPDIDLIRASRPSISARPAAFPTASLVSGAFTRRKRVGASHPPRRDEEAGRPQADPGVPVEALVRT